MVKKLILLLLALLVVLISGFYFITNKQKVTAGDFIYTCSDVLSYSKIFSQNCDLNGNTYRICTEQNGKLLPVDKVTFNMGETIKLVVGIEKATKISEFPDYYSVCISSDLLDIDHLTSACETNEKISPQVRMTCFDAEEGALPVLIEYMGIIPNKVGDIKLLKIDVIAPETINQTEFLLEGNVV